MVEGSSWGTILSDIDLLLVRGDMTAVVEVKSKRDKLGRARDQLLALRDYVDFAYVATDQNGGRWHDRNIGIIRIEGESVHCMKEPRRFTARPSLTSTLNLYKSTLLRLLGKDHHSTTSKVMVFTLLCE